MCGGRWGCSDHHPITQARNSGSFCFWSHDRLLQRDRPVRGSVAAQSDQRRAHSAWHRGRTQMQGAQMALTAIESFKGAKNKHPMTLCKCDCGGERLVRTTRFRLGLVSSCAACARREAAARGGLTRSLPVDVAMNREIRGVYLGNARRRGLVFDLNEEQVTALIRSACLYCGAPADPTNGIDRRDNSEGYTAANAVPCCSMCNYAKRDLTHQQFLEWAKRIHDHQSLLQRNRSVLLCVAEQPDGRRPHNARGDL